MKKALRIVYLIAALGILFSSCKEDDKISGQQSSAVQDQATADAYFSDASDMSTSAYSSPSSSDFSGRTNSGAKGIVTFTVSSDTRLNGATLSLQATDNSTLLIPQGTITIDFGTGKTDPVGTLRKGKISVVYYGLRYVAGSYFSVTFDGYEVNGIKVQGKRTVTTTMVDANSVTFAVKDEDGKITYTDNTTVTRQSVHSRKWIKGLSLSANQWMVEGTASGTTRDSRAYSLLITSPLIFKVECALKMLFLPSEGEATLTVDNLPIQLNYGAAGSACDKIIKVNVGGITQDVTVN